MKFETITEENETKEQLITKKELNAVMNYTHELFENNDDLKRFDYIKLFMEGLDDYLEEKGVPVPDNRKFAFLASFFINEVAEAHMRERLYKKTGEVVTIIKEGLQALLNQKRKEKETGSGGDKTT